MNNEYRAKVGAILDLLGERYIIQEHGLTDASKKYELNVATDKIMQLLKEARVEELKNVDGWMTSEWAQPIGQFKYPGAHQLVADRIKQLKEEK